MRRYLLVFLIGWVFNGALDVNQVAHATIRWLQYGGLATFLDLREPPRNR